MKLIFASIAVLLLLLSANLKAQDQTKIQLPLVDNKIEYSGLINLPDTNYSKAKLFSLAEGWFASTFRDSKQVLRVDDRENGIIIGRGNVLYIPGSEWKQTVNLYLFFYVEIDVKKGKYRYKVYNMTFTGSKEVSASDEYNGYLTNNKIKKRVIKDMGKDFLFIDQQITGLVQNIQSAMGEIKTDTF
jgi:hypothetical protein